jgi:hypothetical protein
LAVVRHHGYASLVRVPLFHFLFLSDSVVPIPGPATRSLGVGASLWAFSCGVTGTCLVSHDLAVAGDRDRPSERGVVDSGPRFGLCCRDMCQYQDRRQILGSWGFAFCVLVWCCRNLPHQSRLGGCWRPRSPERKSLGLLLPLGAVCLSRPVIPCLPTRLPRHAWGAGCALSATVDLLFSGSRD